MISPELGNDKCFFDGMTYILDIFENLKQTNNHLDTLKSNVRTFEGDTGKELNLANFLDEYNLSLYDILYVTQR